jgi:hypothetical protein
MGNAVCPGCEFPQRPVARICGAARPAGKFCPCHPVRDFSFFRSDLVGLGRIWSDWVGLGRIGSDSPGFGGPSEVLDWWIHGLLDCWDGKMGRVEAGIPAVPKGRGLVLDLRTSARLDGREVLSAGPAAAAPERRHGAPRMRKAPVLRQAGRPATTRPWEGRANGAREFFGYVSFIVTNRNMHSVMRQG